MGVHAPGRSEAFVRASQKGAPASAFVENETGAFESSG
jgi:hypothetical protein